MQRAVSITTGNASSSQDLWKLRTVHFPIVQKAIKDAVKELWTQGKIQKSPVLH